MTYITIDNEDYTMRSTMTVDGDMRDVDRIIYHALRDRESERWTSNAMRRPEAAGDYLVTLEWRETESFYADDGTTDAMETGRMRREVGVRYYAAPGLCDGWEMDGENPEDYHWTEQTGSAWHEHVAAWMPLPEVYRGELAGGYEYVWE